ncbi:guanidinoacetate N-methyltransferase B-like, partial [Convolutriloba macropyga]|uniref:guanidinoacetate N-methyltransferase B-like n=1 Tax=Convolutriloba macropyga TaxID=536237 RepID=UPI003F524F87
MTSGYQDLPKNSIRETWSGKEVDSSSDFLRIDGHPVMERWETPYMEKLAQTACRNGGVVLEVGLGMAISAAAIQKCNPSKHIIIELNQRVIEEQKAFISSHPSIEILSGDWRDVLDQLEDSSLDGVLYDTYPMSKEEQHVHQFAFIEKVRPKLKPNAILTYCNLTSLGVLYSQYSVK